MKVFAKAYRFLSLLVALCMIIATLPVSAAAAEADLLPLAGVEITNGSLSPIVSGEKIFTDRDNHFWNTNLPEWLANTTYVKSGLVSGPQITVTHAGWLYALTPATGYGSTREAYLSGLGFEKVTTLNPGTIASTMMTHQAVMGKQVSVGETFSYPGAWILFIAGEGEILGELAEVEYDGEYDTVKSGGKIFSNRDHAWHENIADYLKGKTYLKTPLTNDETITVKKAGWIYALSPMSGNSSKTASLISMGFEKVDTLLNGTVSPTVSGDVAVMGRYFAKGETYTYPGAWTVLITDVATPFDPTKITGEEFATVLPSEGKAQTITPGEVLFKEDNTLWSDTIPDYLNGKTYINTSIHSGANFTVKKDGWVYVLTIQTPTHGFSRKAALVEMGFEEFAVLASHEMSPTYGSPISVMGRWYTAGETYTHPGSWAVILANVQEEFDPTKIIQEEFAEVVPNGGEKGIITTGQALFSDTPDIVWSDTVPDYLKGKEYIVTRGMQGFDFTVKKDGWVYVLTIQAETHGFCKRLELIEAGFSEVAVLKSNEMSPTYGSWVSVMGKEFKAGEKYTHPGTMAIVIAKVDDTYVPEDPREKALEPAKVIINPAAQLAEHPEYAEYLDGGRPWQGMASMAKDNKSGRLWANWYSGGTGEGPLNYVPIYTSDDDGATWKGPIAVIDPQAENVRAFDPNIWTDPDGRMWVIWTQSYYRFDGRAGVWVMYTDNPEDEYPTWSEPYRIANGVGICDPLVLEKPVGDLPAGTWLMPAAVWQRTAASEIDETMASENHPNCYVSYDKGLTWQYYSSVMETQAARTFDENMIVQNSDGTLTMYIRTDAGIERSESSDGKNWTSSVFAGITETSARFWIGKLEDGVLLAVYNAVGRGHMTAALSYDDGATWPEKIVLQTPYSIYPDIHIDDKGTIYIIHCENPYNDMEILMSRITKEDIKAGRIVGENSNARIVINDNTVCEVTSVELDKEDATIDLKYENKLQLNANVVFSNNNNVDKSLIWETSDASVATVDKNGLVTAVGKGSVVIKATANNNGKSDSVAINVIKTEVPMAAISVTGINCGVNAEIDGKAYNWGYMHTESFDTGTKIKLTAITSGNEKFMYWIDAKSQRVVCNAEEYSFVAGSDASFNAVFAPENGYFISFTSANGKVLSSSDAGEAIVPADPYLGGYIFEGWYLDGAKQELEVGQTVSTSDKDLCYRAGFKKSETKYTVTLVNANEESAQYSYNDKVTVTAKDRSGEGLVFNCWKKNGITVSYNAEYSFYVSGDEEIEACYGESVSEKAGIVSIVARQIDDTRMGFFTEYDIPESYTVIETGILMGAASGLDLDSAPIKAVAVNKFNKGQFTVRKASLKAGDVYYARGYVIYSDGEKTYTLYSDEISAQMK